MDQFEADEMQSDMLPDDDEEVAEGLLDDDEIGDEDDEEDEDEEGIMGESPSPLLVNPIAFSFAFLSRRDMQMAHVVPTDLFSKIPLQISKERTSTFHLQCTSSFT